jgi:transcriptional regulator with XRE-family HTH domain
MEIHSQIKNLRKSKGIVQDLIAEQIGVSRPQYSRLESGKAEFTISLLEKIAKVLDVSIADFFKSEDSLELDSYNSSTSKKIKLIEQLDEETQKSIFRFIDIAILNQRLTQGLQNTLSLTS